MANERIHAPFDLTAIRQSCYTIPHDECHINSVEDVRRVAPHPEMINERQERIL